MDSIVSLLPYIQIVLSLLLIGGIILQQTGAGLGGAFGDNFSSTFHTRRGSEKIIFNFTLVVAILFAIVSILDVITLS